MIFIFLKKILENEPRKTERRKRLPAADISLKKNTAPTADNRISRQDSSSTIFSLILLKILPTMMDSSGERWRIWCSNQENWQILTSKVKDKNLSRLLSCIFLSVLLRSFYSQFFLLSVLISKEKSWMAKKRK